MKKIEQLAINEQVLTAIDKFNEVFGNTLISFSGWKQLRSCSAEVAQVGHYSVLRSYSTIIAVIDHETDTLYDFLRYVYGYTSTSAQHVSKFDKDYGSDKWGCAHRLTYKEV